MLQAEVSHMGRLEGLEGAGRCLVVFVGTLRGSMFLGSDAKKSWS